MSQDDTLAGDQSGLRDIQSRNNMAISVMQSFNYEQFVMPGTDTKHGKNGFKD